MTRFLSTSLQAAEPAFRSGIQRLESANLHPKTDIRLSAEVVQATQNKLRQLGLDPHDTTPRELYNVLQSRIVSDDRRLTMSLRTRAALYVSAEGDVIEGMLHALKDSTDTKRCFALKQSVVKSLLKAQPPKKAMKKLGYRSVDSLLKNETGVAIIAAAWLTETAQWQSKLLDQYKKLKPSDFESRSIAITHLRFKKWPQLAEEVVVLQKHNILSFRELGALVLLPLPKAVPAGAVTTSLTLALHELNEIRASSTFLKLSQVRADFGSVVRMVATDQAELSSQVLDQPVPWNLIQQYYARSMHHFREVVFEPHVQADDIVWHPVEQALSAIEPSMAFWHDTAHLGMLHGRHAVSCNIVDVALNYVNRVPFEHRISQYFRSSLWHELLLRYLQHGSVEQSVLQDLQPNMAAELALA